MDNLNSSATFNSAMHRSYRYRFYPTPEQEALLRRT
ncbi:helix-turn-helix domain-containing protein, partial [Listeria monocytogenes]